MEMQPNLNLVTVSGVSGAGKDFLLNEVRGTIGQQADIEFIHFGGLIRDIARAKKPAGYQEASGGLRGINPEVMDAFKLEAIDALIEKMGNHSLQLSVLNYHLTYKPQGQVKVDMDTVLALRPRDFIVVTSDPEEILSRRASDNAHRNRELESVDAIDRQQNLEVQCVGAITKYIGARALVISNSSNDSSTLNKNVELVTERILNP